MPDSFGVHLGAATTFLPQNGVKGWGEGSWVETLATESDDPSSIPRTHMVEGEDQLLQLFFDQHPPPHTHTGESGLVLDSKYVTNLIEISI